MPGRLSRYFLLRLLVIATAAASLLPLARIVSDWYGYARVLGLPLEAPPPRGYDGVVWSDDGEIAATYVFPESPAGRAGVRAGDRLYRLDFQQVFSADDLVRFVERASGTVLTYEVVRGDSVLTADVPIARYPTFLYPLSAALWTAAGWGFAGATLVHVLALLTVLPLARRSRRARRAAGLIAAALAWVGGNLLRLLWVSLAGPPGGELFVASVLFDALTLVALGGWILFPLLLFRQAIVDEAAWRAATRWVRPAMFAPPALLGGGVALATIRGSVGPLPPDAFVAPILFYVCVYVAAATLLVVARPALGPARARAADPELAATAWSRAGSAAVFALALGGALFVYNALPALRGDMAGAWFIIALQLFSLAPVGLVSLATLRFGRFDAMLTRALLYAAAAGLVFGVVAGGLYLLDALVPGESRAGPIAVSAWVVLVLLVAERLAPSVRRLAAGLFETERQQARRELDRHSDRVRFFLDVDALAAETVRVAGEALGARSAVLFLRAGSAGGRWAQATYRPEPPSFTEADLAHVWEHIREEGRVWARIAELNESSLPEDDAARLRERGVALAVPVTGGGGEARGLLVLARRTRRRAVYNVEDVEMLRALCAQLALATERLALIEREKALVRQTAEAELVALRAQINPHFLFNALNTIAALVAERPQQAEATVQDLAHLFRDVLNASGRPFVPLADELRLVRRYLAVEQARFGEALAVAVEADDDALERLVPAFAVQTLVENAVKHGIERKRGGGAVCIRAATDADARLRVTVEDTGAGIPALLAAPPGDGALWPGSGPPPPQEPTPVPPPEAQTPSPEAQTPSPKAQAPRPGSASLAHHSLGEGRAETAAPWPAYYGVGLRNVAERLRQSYGPRAALQIASSPDGTSATLLLPPPADPPLAHAPDAHR